jgi:hypothetical protein
LKILAFLPYVFIFALVGLSCQEKEKVIDTTSEDVMYTLDFTDSVMIDYIGQIAWSDISSDGQHILATNPQNSDILLMSIDGEIIGNFNKSGDQPDAIGGSPLSRPQFVKENEWAMLGKNGVMAFDFEGQFTKAAKPDFPMTLSMTISNANILHFMDEEKALVYYLGRDGKNTFYVNPESSQLEIIDLNNGDFTAALPIPKDSKFRKSDKIQSVITATPVMEISDGKLYLAFKNEPKLWIYDLNNLDEPLEQIDINFDQFIEKEGVNPKEVEQNNLAFSSKDFTYAAINKILAHDDQVLLQYTKGLTDAEFEEITESTKDQMEIFSRIFEKNKNHYCILSTTGKVHPIIMPDKAGAVEFWDMEGNLWVGYNQEEELDYEVLYKSKLEKAD